MYCAALQHQGTLTARARRPRGSAHIVHHTLADIVANIVRLNAELVGALHALIEALEKTPSETAREQEDVLAIQNNLMHLCNMLRPVQARATLRHMLARSAEQKRNLIQRLNDRYRAAPEAVMSSRARTATHAS